MNSQIIIKLKYKIVVCFLMISSHYHLNAQTYNEYSKDSVFNELPSSINSRFDHHGNIFYWIGKGKYLLKKKDFNLTVNEEFTSNIVESNQKYIQDFQFLNIKLYDSFFDDVKYCMQINSNIFSDNKSIGISNAFSHTGLFGLGYNPVSYFWLSALGGWSIDNQMGNKDQGLSLLFNTKVNNYDISGYNTSLEGEWNIDYLNPRLNNQKKISLFIQKRFSSEAWTNFNFFYRIFDKDFYINDVILKKLNIERRGEYNFNFSNEINYLPTPEIWLSLNSNFSNRKVNKSIKYKSIENLTSNIFDSRINEFKLDLLFQVSASFEKIRSNFKFGTNQREENHTLDYYEGVSKNYFINRSKSESYKDNIATSSFLALYNNISITENNNLSVFGLYKLLRYDTPSENNYDDRDEIQLLVGITDEHKFQDNLNIFFNFEFNKYRTIFIFGERSANNQSNNILKFSTYSQYYYQNLFKTKNFFEVLANYTVYDYKDKVLSLKNLSFRQFQFFDSTLVNLTKYINIDLFANVRFSQRGELFWDSFKEKPADYYVDETYSVTLWLNNNNYNIGLGYKTFIQTRYTYKANDKIFDYKQINSGPTAIISYITEIFNLKIIGWLETIYFQNSTHQTNRNLVFDMFYYF